MEKLHLQSKHNCYSLTVRRYNDFSVRAVKLDSTYLIHIEIIPVHRFIHWIIVNSFYSTIFWERYQGEGGVHDVGIISWFRQGSVEDTRGIRITNKYLSSICVTRRL